MTHALVVESITYSYEHQESRERALAAFETELNSPLGHSVFAPMRQLLPHDERPHQPPVTASGEDNGAPVLSSGGAVDPAAIPPDTLAAMVAMSRFQSEDDYVDSAQRSRFVGEVPRG